jgi:hypothetical protein
MPQMQQSSQQQQDPLHPQQMVQVFFLVMFICNLALLFQFKMEQQISTTIQMVNTIPIDG